MANFALNYSFSRNLNIPLDEDAVKSTLDEVRSYVRTKNKCYAGQLFSVTGDTISNNGLYITLSVGQEGSVIKLASQDALDAVAASAGKIDEIKLNGTTLTINDKVVNIDLSDYSKVDYVDSALLSAKTYTDQAIAATEEKLQWIPVGDEAEKHLVRHWRGSRANYEFLLKNNAVNDWTRYVVIDTVNNKEVITEYYGVNQVAEHTGQLLPVISVIENISDITPTPYDRYLVGTDESGYNIYEYVIDTENNHRWIIKPFDYRYGVRIKEFGLKNYIYFDGHLFTYDDVNGGEF